MGTLLTAAELTQMAADATSVTEGIGSVNSVSLTYTKQSSRTYTPTSGAESETTVTGSITGHRCSIQSVPDPGDGKEAGDVAFVVTRSALEATSLGTSFVPSRRDRITLASEEYEVLWWTMDALRLRYYFVCKLVAT